MGDYDKDLWVEHDDYTPSKPERKVGRHEKPIEPFHGETVVERLKDAGIDKDPRVTHGTDGSDDDIMRLRIGEDALAQARPVLTEFAARTQFQESAVLLSVDEELDNSLEVDPFLEDDSVERGLDDS